MRASWGPFIVIGSILLLARAATADNALPSREPEKRSSSGRQTEVLQEIVVTATRRSEEESKVPISIVALDQAALNTSGIKTISDVANHVPGIQFDTSAGFGPNILTNVAIRGVNSNVGTSTTGIYLDDVPIQTRITALSNWGNPYPLLFDADRLEVERGPQGTLFGAGAEGGAIRFISPDPGYGTYTGMAHAELASTQGGDPSYEGGVAVGGPIAVDAVGFRVSAWGRKDGGYVDRVDPFTNEIVEKNSNSTRFYVVRGALGIRPNGAITITPSVFAQGIRYNDSGAYFEYLSHPAENDYKNGRLLQQVATDNFYLPSLKIEGFLSGATITSVTAYFHRWGDLTQDATSYNGAIFGPSVSLGPGPYPSYGNPLGAEYPARYSDAGPGYFETKVDLFTQEIRASSIDENARLRWTMGAFYSQSSQTDTVTVISPFFAVNLFEIPPDEPLFLSRITSKDTQIAGFAQIDYRITPPVTLTVGGRLAHHVARFTQAQSGPVASQEFPYASGEQSETPFIPKVGVAYQATRSNLLYLSAAKGYRVGGANQPIPLAPTPGGCPLSKQPPPFDSDSLWSFELGSKNRLFDGRVRLDVSVFYVRWQRIQQGMYFTHCAAGFIANAGDAVSKGFDLASDVALTERLKVGFSMSYIDAYNTKTVTFDGATVVQAGDAVGSPPGVGSPWNIGGYAEYGFSVLSDRAYVRIEDFYRSENPGPFNTQIPSTPLYTPEIPANPAYNQLNARFGLTHSAIDFALFVNNVSNSRPALYRYMDTATTTLFTDTSLRPRTIGLTATYRF
jgi:outer membrane receptor protein involved in Fe transport